MALVKDGIDRPDEKKNDDSLNKNGREVIDVDYPQDSSWNKGNNAWGPKKYMKTGLIEFQSGFNKNQEGYERIYQMDGKKLFLFFILYNYILFYLI